MGEDFKTWLRKTLTERNLSYSAFARQCDVSPALVSKVISGKMKPSRGFCEKTAVALNEPPEKILRLAGILPPLPSDDSPLASEAAELVRNLPADTQGLAIDFLRMLYRRSQDSDDD